MGGFGRAVHETAYKYEYLITGHKFVGCQKPVSWHERSIIGRREMDSKFQFRCVRPRPGHCGSGRSAASSTSRAGSGSGEKLAFAHIPTGTATNHRFDIDEVNSRLVKPGVAPTAYRSRYRNWQGHTLTTGSGCLTIGVHLTLIVPPSFSGLWNISLPS